MKTTTSFLILVLLLSILTSSCSLAQNPQEQTKIRIGWQTTWATQGQIVQTLAHTDVLARNGLDPEFVGVTYGAPLNEAALAGEVDNFYGRTTRSHIDS